MFRDASAEQDPEGDQEESRHEALQDICEEPAEEELGGHGRAIHEFAVVSVLTLDSRSADHL